MQFEYFIVLNKNQCKKNQIWVRKEYVFDKERNSYPSQRYVFDALTIDVKDKLVISVSDNLKAALSENDYVLNNITKLKNAKQPNIPRKIRKSFNF